MRGVARIGHDHPPRERQDADVLLTLETVVFAVLVGQGRRDILGRLVQALVAFLGLPRLSVCSILLDFGPQRFVGSTHLTRNRARHLGRQMKAGTHLIVGAILQSHPVAHLAVLKSVRADVVQGIAIRQLRVAQGLELCGGSQQFELGGNDRFHMFYCINISTACQEEEISEGFYTGGAVHTCRPMIGGGHPERIFGEQRLAPRRIGLRCVSQTFGNARV